VTEPGDATTAFPGSLALIGGLLATMNRLSHRRMRRAVSAFDEGVFDGDTAAAVAAHLRRCWGCSGDAELARMMKRSLRRLADRQPDSLAAVRLRRFAASLRN